ncbi:MAG: regulatory iron-sulfur-containing complex subunit RicT [Coriobacteriales bacterium]|nr:regulatory iron-sulfur-containing complex subunit RicT [Coriobacteriales bacterium]
MPTVIPVKFSHAVRDLWFDAGTTGALEGDHVVCSTERGTEIGLATSNPREMSEQELSKTIGNATLKPVLRVATEADLNLADRLARKGDETFPTFRRLVSESGLDMKPVAVEYLFGGEKVVCYFAAEERVDFRQLVRDLSRELHERIDMRQIGVREEAAVVGGFGHCGQELCCARFGLSFEPVSIRMAKEQDLPLTSNKISGACGRLMCCLRYEFEAYRDFKGRAPKRNAVIDTPLGKAKIVEYDTPKEEICMRIENGKIVRIPLAEMVTSEAAVKKSEELHCPCRPDTVVRESLEKLSSPDVQMALAELDRKNGVVPPDAFDEADLFVETKPRKRRKRKGSGAQGTGAQGQVADEAGASQGEQAQPSRRRRRRKKSAAAPADAAPRTRAEAQERRASTAAAKETEAPEKRTRRRRRRRLSVSGAGEAATQTQAPAKAQAPATGDEKSAEKGTERRRHRQAKRRPGDRAGQKSEQQPSSQPKPQSNQGGQPAGEAPKRRRRRRRTRKPEQGDQS